MKLRLIVKIALHALLANKLRSCLTMLGIIIGVGSVIAMLAIGEGAKIQVTKQVESFGVTTLSIRPGLKGVGGAKSADTHSLTFQDADAILREIPGIEAVAPVVAIQAQILAGGRNMVANCVGITEDYPNVRGFKLERGRLLTAEDDAASRQYCILGAHVVEELFPDGDDPIGREVKIGIKYFTVVGTFVAKGYDGSDDNQVYIPLRLGMKRVFGIAAGAAGSLHGIHVKVDATGDEVGPKMQLAELRLDRFFRERHHIHPEETPDFYIRNNAEILRQTEEAGRTFTVLLGSVAGISLLVGGIGIMNIMLVTVTERTKEIGIRKALGARPWDILKQFIVESAVLSMIGGALGVGMGLGAAHIIPSLSEWFPDFPRFTTSPTASSVALSFGFAAVVGVFFGFFPARRAARLDAIHCLRYE